jgi:hypothetical protein
LEAEGNHHSSGTRPNGLAVNPSNDHLLIAESVGTIAEYKSVAEGSDLISASIAEGLHQPGTGKLAIPYESVAVDGDSGDIYLFASDAFPSPNYVIAVLTPDGSSIINKITGADTPRGSLPAGSFGTGLAVDQTSGHIYINQFSGAPGSGEIYEFKPDGTFVSAIGPTFGGSLSFEDSGPSGLAVDNSATPNAGNVYVGSGALDAQVYEFGPLVTTQPLTVTKAGTGSGNVTSSPAGIDCGSTCGAEFNEGSTVTLTQSAGVGSAFSGWSGCTSEAEAGKKCLVTIGATNAVTATFEPKAPEFALSVTKAGAGAGSVTSSPAGIDCGSKCSAEYEEGEEVTLSASAASGSSFAGWSGACTGTGTCKVTMSAASAVTATFTAASNGGGGGGTTTPPPAPTCATNAALCPPGTASVGSKAQVKSGKAALSVTCPGPGACSGKVTLTAKITTGKGKNKKTKKQTIGSASFSLSPGGSSTIQVKLTGAAKSAIAKGTLKASVSGTGVAADSVKLSQGGGK